MAFQPLTQQSAGNETAITPSGNGGFQPLTSHSLIQTAPISTPTASPSANVQPQVQQPQQGNNPFGGVENFFGGLVKGAGQVINTVDNGFNGAFNGVENAIGNVAKPVVNKIVNTPWGANGQTLAQTYSQAMSDLSGGSVAYAPNKGTSTGNTNVGKLEQSEPQQLAVDNQNALNQRVNDFKTKANQFKNDYNTFKQKADYWKSQGGAPQNIYNQLVNQQAQLQQRQTALQNEEKQINSSAKNQPSYVQTDALRRFGTDATDVLLSILQGATANIFKSPVKNLNPEAQVIEPLSQVAGQIYSFSKISDAAGSVLGNTPIIKAFPPTSKLGFIPKLLSNFAGLDVYNQLDPQTKDHFKTLLYDATSASILDTLSAYSKIKYTVPIAFGSGVALAKMNGASNIDALKSGALFAALDLGGKLPSIMFDSQFKNGTKEFTPQEARDWVANSPYKNTEFGQQVMKDSFTAEEQGKNMKVNITAAKQGAGARFFKMDGSFSGSTPHGVSLSYDLVNPAPENPGLGTGETPQPTTPNDSGLNTITPESVTGGIPSDYKLPTPTGSAAELALANEEPTGKNLVHGTNNTITSVNEGGLHYSRNASGLLGKAVYFSDSPHTVIDHGANYVSLPASKFNLKTFPSFESQQKFIQENNATNLSDAIRNNGKYDGFVIPNPDSTVGNTVGLVDLNKVNQEIVGKNITRPVSLDYQKLNESVKGNAALQEIVTLLEQNSPVEANTLINNNDYEGFKKEVSNLADKEGGEFTKLRDIINKGDLTKEVYDEARQFFTKDHNESARSHPFNNPVQQGHDTTGEAGSKSNASGNPEQVKDQLVNLLAEVKDLPRTTSSVFLEKFLLDALSDPTFQPGAHDELQKLMNSGTFEAFKTNVAEYAKEFDNEWTSLHNDLTSGKITEEDYGNFIKRLGNSVQGGNESQSSLSSQTGNEGTKSIGNPEGSKESESKPENTKGSEPNTENAGSGNDRSGISSRESSLNETNRATGNGRGIIPKELEPLEKSARNSKTLQEFLKKHEQADLMDLSDRENHRFGRIFADTGEGIKDLPTIINEYGDTATKDYPDANVPNISSPDKKVTIYRSAPITASTIEPGDYVSFSKDYADNHNRGKLLSVKVPAKDVIWQGNDFNEWIYSPANLRDNYKNLEDFYNQVKRSEKPENPQTYYHASPVEGIKELKASKDGTLGEGVYLSKSKDLARTYAAYQGDGNLADVHTYATKLKPGELFKVKEDGTLSKEQINQIKKEGYIGIETPSETVVFDSKNVEVTGFEKATEGNKSTSRETIYRGGRDMGDARVLRQADQRSGAIFFTPSEKYAHQYSKEPDGKSGVYKYTLQPNDKIFDITNPADVKQFIDNSKNWEGYDNSQDAKKDAEYMIQSMKDTTSHNAVDWATASQYIDNIQQSGFTGAKFLERPGENIKENPDGSYNISGNPVYSYAMFKDDIPVERAYSRAKLPEIPQEHSSSVSLNSGFNPGLDKFIDEDLTEAAKHAKEKANQIVSLLTYLKDFTINAVEPAKVVETKLGGDAYAKVIKAIHTPEAEDLSFNTQASRTFDKNFSQLEKFFSRFSEKDLKVFNLTRGEAESADAKAIQSAARGMLNPVLQDPKIMQAITEVSDHVFQFAQDNGVDLNYFEDYFYGNYKGDSKNAVENFLDYWKSTDRFTKEKKLPTIADAEAFGLSLKDQNPITNIRQEMYAVSKRVGLLRLRTEMENQGASYMVNKADATPDQLKNWKKIEDPAFKDLLFDPDFARLANNLIEKNNVMRNPLLKGLRVISYGAQQIKFFGSLYHLQNITKAALADSNMGIVDPGGYKQILKSFKPINTADPVYKEYVNLGGGHNRALEVQAEHEMMKALDKIGRGNFIGGLLKLPVGLAQMKFIPASPGNIKWMFEDYIPAIKFNKYQQVLSVKQRQLGRMLTDAEKIRIIKDNQNFYGEMNERLFGRSATITSALRILFNAPSYSEGNFRTALRAIISKESKRRNLGFILHTFIVAAVLGAIGTRIMTGKWPDVPTKSSQVRDLFKMKSNMKDGNGDTIYYDMLGYGSDYYSIYGNMLTGQFGKIPSDLITRFAGLFSTTTHALTDISTIVQGGTVVDYRQQPIYYRTDSFPTKVAKFIAYEANIAQPISTGTLSSATQKGVDLPKAIVSSILGVRATTSEAVKATKAAKADLISLQTATQNERMTLNKLYNENPAEAVKQARAFNQAQLGKLKQIMQQQGSTSINTSILKQYYLITKLKKGAPKNGSTINTMLQKNTP